MILVLFIFSCNKSTTFAITDVQQLTFVGDNGEGYFNAEATEIVFQSKRDGNECDKLYLIDINGENFREFPAQDGAFTCAYYALNNEFIF